MRATDRVHPPRSTLGYQQWARQEAERDPDELRFRLAIEAVPDGVLVGSINTLDVDERAGRFGYGLAIAPEHRHRGYATQAIIIVLRYMFGERRLHKCGLWVYAFNTASIRLHQQLGFTEEGRLREHEFAGQHQDVIMFGMTITEFTKRYSVDPLA